MLLREPACSFERKFQQSRSGVLEEESLNVTTRNSTDFNCADRVARSFEDRTIAICSRGGKIAEKNLEKEARISVEEEKEKRKVDWTSGKDELNSEYVITGTSLSQPCSWNVVASRSWFWSRFQPSKIEGPTYQVPLFLKERIREQVLKRHTSVSLSVVRGLPRTRPELVEKRRIIGERERRRHKVPLLAFLLMLLLEPPYLREKEKEKKKISKFFLLLG